MLSLIETRILELWLDELGLDKFIDALREICRSRAEYLFEKLPPTEQCELEELEKQCERQSFRLFGPKSLMPSSREGRMTEMWRNAVRGLSNLSRGALGKFRISTAGLPSKDCYDGGLNQTARTIVRRELKAAARIVELVVLPEISIAEGRSASAFADSNSVREAYARLKDAMAAYDAARNAA